MNLIESKSVVCYSKHVFVCTASFVKCSHTRQSQIRLTLGIPFPLAHSLARWFCASLVLIYATCTLNIEWPIVDAQGDSQSLCKWIYHRMNWPQAKSFSGISNIWSNAKGWTAVGYGFRGGWQYFRSKEYTARYGSHVLAFQLHPSFEDDFSPHSSAIWNSDAKVRDIEGVTANYPVQFYDRLRSSFNLRSDV